MEPFGLFQLLQSFLSAAPAQSPTPPPAQEDAAPQSEENISTPNEPQAPSYTPAQSAALGFMDAHERRARKLR